MSLIKKTGYTGTLVRTRKLLLKVVRGKKFRLEKGEMKAWRDGKKMVMAWRDKGKPTVLVSSVHPASTTTVRDRWGYPKVKHLVVDRYNHNMGGVDKVDQYSVYYSFGRRSMKW